jgi:hypothetical protein
MTRGLRHVLEKKHHEGTKHYTQQELWSVQDAKPCVGLPILAILCVYLVVAVFLSSSSSSSRERDSEIVRLSFLCVQPTDVAEAFLERGPMTREPVTADVQVSTAAQGSVPT